MRNVTIWLCHHLKLYMDFHISLKMSPFEYVTIWKHFKPVTILVWKHIFYFHNFFQTKHSYGDKCHHMSAWSENFHTCHQKMAFKWWRSERFYHRGSGSSALKARAESSTISEKPEDENLGPSSSLPVPHYTGRLSYQKYVSSKVWTDLSFAQDTLKTARELDLAGTLPQH